MELQLIPIWLMNRMTLRIERISKVTLEDREVWFSFLFFPFLSLDKYLFFSFLIQFNYSLFNVYLFFGTDHHHVDVDCLWESLSLSLANLFFYEVCFVTYKDNGEILGSKRFYLFDPYCNWIKGVSVINRKDKQYTHNWTI